jgi:hypothetical protein
MPKSERVGEFKMNDMKKIILIVLLIFSMQQTQAQVWDITTGVDPFMNLLPLNTPDDNWTMCPPSGNPANPGSYIPVMCSNGAPAGFSPYFGHWNTVRWLSPNVTPIGEHEGAPIGDYYFKYTFETGACEIESAVINLDHIGADNYIDQLIINGNVYPVYYTFSPFTNGVTINLTPWDILPNSVNELLVRVHNYGSYTGMEIAGNITVQTVGGPDPSFGSSYVGNQLNLGSAVSGTHTWEIYGSATGNPGTYNYIGTFNSPSLAIGSGYSCLLVKHTVSNECGTACKAISICNLDCSWQPCGIVEPTNLHYDPSTNKLSWDPVPGVDHYVIEIVLNDPACCGDGTVNPDGPIFASNYRTITTYSNSYTLTSSDIGDFYFRCFSWRVLAVCANGYSTSSAFKCENSWRDYGTRSETIENENPLDDPFNAKVFPNPSKDLVSIAIENERPVNFEVKIYDINGKLVKTFVNMDGKEKNITLQWNAEDARPGTYLVVITTSENKVLQRKLVIE